MDLAAYNSILNQINGTNVHLIAVSKTQASEKILALHQAGQIDFGENYIQETRLKARILPEEINWHFIGRLQKNKVKYCPNIFSTIHSLSDIAIATELNKHYGKANKTVDCLIQMNLSLEETKNGIYSKDELFKLTDALTQLPNINLIGLMTMPKPNMPDSYAAKIYAKLAAYKIKLAQHVGDKYSISELSMGMSHDYKIALAQGATMIRIGSTIFGPRQSAK